MVIEDGAASHGSSHYGSTVCEPGYEMRQVTVTVSDSAPVVTLRIALDAKGGSFDSHGVYHFPFAFALPVDTQGSLEVPQGGTGTPITGSVRYWLKAMLTRKGLKFNVGSPQRDFVVAPLFTSVPVAGGGAYTATLSLDRNAAVPGETVMAHLHVANNSPMPISSVTFQIVQTISGTRRSPPESGQKSLVIFTSSRPGAQPYTPLTIEIGIPLPPALWATVTGPLLRNEYAVVAVIHPASGPDVHAGVGLSAPPSVVLAPPPGVDPLPLDGTVLPERKVGLKSWHMYFIDVPALTHEARLEIVLRGTSKATLALRLRKASQPSHLTSYDFAGTKAGKHVYSIAINKNNGVPLQQGRWFVGVWGTNVFPPSSKYVLSATLTGAAPPPPPAALPERRSSLELESGGASSSAAPSTSPKSATASASAPPPPSFHDPNYASLASVALAGSAYAAPPPEPGAGSASSVESSAADGAGVADGADDNSSYSIAASELQRGELVGSGAFGVVHRGTWRGGDVAIKTIKVDSLASDAVAEFKAEAKLMRLLPPHPNVVQFLGVCKAGENELCIVSSFVPGGTLLALLHPTSGFVWNVEKKLGVAVGIAAGLLHLSAESIVHRDLAARNILVSVGGHGPAATVTPLLTDFGMSRDASGAGDNYTASVVGPVKWMAVEAITHRKYSAKSDVWSFGVLLFEIFTQTEPYAGLTPLQVAAGVSSGSLTLDLDGHAADIPPPVVDLIQACMAHEPEDRPSVRDLFRTVSHLRTQLSPTPRPISYATVNPFAPSSSASSSPAATPTQTATSGPAFAYSENLGG
ncbi:TKL protein kinase [Thecamonas trahens ATCC 50062]|uniref:TKL protein kinase n=1 Tax=Thecamonas trahens ATCC 50062 TaxID=461836 RepID=A0A0L0DLX7_THETB|nr:TKL protein kinase [Thecamonas trahens ATCC 50062]KNC52393.1 TKL protein kinase [Thecamonas trahens ATCC 50062]|eukprot:XP_013755437.1 TKL protein kinase [Thecamonas trahens ATCC 50062]